MFSVGILLPHLEGADFDHYLVTDLFDLSIKVIQVCDFKYDLRAILVELVAKLVVQTKNCVVIISASKGFDFWDRFQVAFSGSKHLKQNGLVQSLTRLLHVLSLGCLY